MKKLTLITLSTAVLFTLQGRGEATQCVNCPADPNTLFTNITCMDDGTGKSTYTCYDTSSSKTWSGMASSIPQSKLKCDSSGNCSIAKIGTVVTKTSTENQYTLCQYDLMDPAGSKSGYNFIAKYSLACSDPSSSCCSDSDFCCPDSSE